MGVDANRLGTAIYNAVSAFSIPQNAWISDAMREDIWQAVSQEIDTEYSTYAEVAPGTFKDGLNNSITGIGGPVS